MVKDYRADKIVESIAKASSQDRGPAVKSRGLQDLPSM